MHTVDISPNFVWGIALRCANFVKVTFNIFISVRLEEISVIIATSNGTIIFGMIN